MTDEMKITVLKNGPYLISGKVQLVDSEGKPIQTPAKGFALCRCGASMKKPFCDGTHSKIGFDTAANEVPESHE